MIHVVTKKGKGYRFAEEQPEIFHGVGPFDPETGKVKLSSTKSNSDIFGDKMVELAQNNSSVVAITAAMPYGTGLNRFKELFPERLFDVGICEEHALTMAAGMAAGGLHPVVAIYATFLQRGYDELLHDICMQNLPVVIAEDRAGLVGRDGPTHQGVYDVAFLLTIPNLMIYSPATQQELSLMLDMAVLRREPSVIRFNRGSLMSAPITYPIIFGKWEVVCPIRPVTIVATGTMVCQSLLIAKEMHAGLVNARFIRPMDTELLNRIDEECGCVITVEENTLALGEKIRCALEKARVVSLSVPNAAVQQGSVSEQRTMCGVSDADIRAAVAAAQEQFGADE